jgi:hypothetical protein
VDYHVFVTIRQMLGGPATDRRVQRPTSAEDVMDRIEQHFNRIDWLTGLSRRTILGDRAAQQILSSWLESHAHLVVPDSDSSLQRGVLAAMELMAEHPGDAGTGAEALPDGLSEPGRERTLGLNVRAIRELFLGAVYAAGPDEAVRTKALDLIHAIVARSAGLLDVLHYYAVLSFQGLEHTETLPNLLNQLPRGDDLTTFLLGHPLPPQTPNIPLLLEINPILECLGVLREVTVGAGSAFATLQDATEDTLNLTTLIVSVWPASVCAGSDATLLADTSNPAKKFPLKQPADYGVFVEPCGTPAPIKQWTADSVTIEIPAQAKSGCVRFGRVGSSGSGAIADAEHQAIKSFGACFDQFGLGRPGAVGAVSLNPATFCPVTVCPPGSPNYLEVRHKPEIVSFVAMDPAGRFIGTTGVEAGTPVTVSWEVRSDRPSGPLQISMSGAKTLSGLPLVGSLTLSAQDMRASQSLTLTAVNSRAPTPILLNSCGPIQSSLNINVFRKLYVSPTPLAFRVDAMATLTIRSSCPVISNVTVNLAASNPDAPGNPARVTAPPTATIPAGQDGVTVTVSPALTGGITAYIASLKHSQPAAVVTATEPSHTSAAVGVWVEPPSGQSSIGLPTNPYNAVAVHMALLHTGQVLMFSADDTDFNHIDKVKTRIWDPVTNHVVDPSFPYTRDKNLFCAGHCFLADGRLLVVGGHAIFAGGSAAKQVHTFDPATRSWSRHAPMQKDRWYPTCMTLPDGRAVITSGSEGGGPPTIFKGVVRDVEVFDPATNALTRFPNVHGDICMYPYMFVLPGGLVFFHSRNVSKLFTPGPGTWSPTNGSWSAGIPMKGSTTRTYPGMAGCVLLPLLPEEGYSVRVLMAGGGGARESDMNGSKTATRTAEILDVGVSRNTGAWRNTNRSGAPLQMTTFRFMSDAVLLPDGTVLFVNGAAVGKADDAHIPVGGAELFDPQSETFRPLTPMSVPRLYHGTALLLPDGRVAVAGHTKEFNKSPVEMNRFEVEMIAPPYLFRGPRPTIMHIAYTGMAIGYGQNVTVYTDRPADIARVALVRQGSTTHQLNTDQRYVGLTITQRGSGSVTVTAPPDGAVAPPGHYMLFVVDSQGVPSHGQFVRLG